MSNITDTSPLKAAEIHNELTMSYLKKNLINFKKD